MAEQGRNPFTPTFGATPPLLVGRGSEVEDFRAGMQDGPGAPERATLVTGLRGTGKTVMLNAYEDVAVSEGWVVVSETAGPGLLDRLTNTALPELLQQHDPQLTRSRVTGGNVGPAGAQRSVTELHEVTPTLRTRLNRLLEVLPEGNGVLFSIDEVHRSSDLRTLGTVLQHSVREGREVAFVGAGLSSSVQDLLVDKEGEQPTTFLRRADRRHLGAVGAEEVRRGLAVPLADSGREITPAALDLAAAGTHGYPFMIQLVGNQMWRAARGAERIEEGHAADGVGRAQRRIGDLVHDPSLSAVAPTARSFLMAMAQDDGPSRLGDIAERMGVEGNYASQYRARLIRAELIEPAGKGQVNFVMPYMREYLRQHAAAHTWTASTDEARAISQSAPRTPQEGPRRGGQTAPRELPHSAANRSEVRAASAKTYPRPRGPVNDSGKNRPGPNR